eukprot:TRINITY_DN134_c1_g1_i2.p1 TRINITY_DN134_c1_g1~~TRINITY_DN134_c1_g1_i2.p1  ORF type:complete len:117 (-),score=31.99 TRINITY_DN134_c1_g1_i2:104-412(-)
MGGYPHWAKGWQNIPGIDDFFREKVIKDSFRDFRRRMDPNGKFLSAKFAQLMESPKREPGKPRDQLIDAEGLSGIKSEKGTQLEVFEALEILKRQGKVRVIQ